MRHRLGSRRQEDRVERQLTTRFFSTLYHKLFNEAEPGRSQVLVQLGGWLRRHVRD